MTQIRGLEKFLNLNRNGKYRCIEIDWKSTFRLIQEEVPAMKTDFKQSKLKHKKVKLLIAEKNSPPLNKLKNRHHYFTNT
jgi:hypothetical protein